MKKLGFTLAEALIALAIVGVIAAISIPMINRYKPDEDKITFLRTYDSLVEIIKNVADNTRLYPLSGTDSSGNIVDYSEKPLENIVEIKNYNGIKNNNYGTSGNDKLCQILADAFKATSPTCTTGTSTKLTLNDVNFTTPDGIDFYMKTDWPTTTNTYKTVIKFDINGGEGPNCVYSTDSNSLCEKPDQFEVLVGSNGYVVASDEMSQKYLQTRGSYRKTDLDLEDIEKVETLPDAFIAESMCDTKNFDDNKVACCADTTIFGNNKSTCCNLDEYKLHESCIDCENGYSPSDQGYIPACHSQYCNYYIEVSGWNTNWQPECRNQVCGYFKENRRFNDFAKHCGMEALESK